MTDLSAALQNTPEPQSTNALQGTPEPQSTNAPQDEIRSSLVYERLMTGDVRRRVSADRVDRLAPVLRP
ncbi:hypothetical protein GS910_42975 [Paraburkholderia sp. RL16-012-BIC-B]|uniref:hypothetical protein n=1 Tax=Paraburkholderia madseniana TaxID=2599607 RepID=UPI0015C53605|nr:hypothetical protein [Paraburkholderia madseniana]NPT70906.1 hypothetical protein [Paraburkholderia madseniana]